MKKYLRILQYFRGDSWALALSLVFMGLSTLLGLLWAFPVAILVDLQTGKGIDLWIYRWFYNMTPKGNVIHQVLFLTGLMVVIRLGSQIFQSLQTILSIRVGLNGMMRARCDLFRKLQELSVGYHRSQPQGDAIYRVAWDTYGFQGVLNVLVTILVNFLTLILMAILAFGISWKVTLLSLVVVPPIVLVIRLYGKVLKDRSIDAKEKDSGLYTTIQRSMTSIGLVQAFGRETDEYNRFGATVQRSVTAYYRLHWHEVIYWFLLGTVFALGATAIFGYGAYLVYQEALAVSALIIFLDYAAKLYDPLSKLSTSGSSMITAMAGVDRVFEVLDRDPVIKDAPDAIALPRQARRLELDHVVFAYRDGEPVIRDMTVSIEPGQMVAFVGSSGVGKTTLLSLFPRFYDPSSGALKLDGIDLRKIKIKSLRAHIALVLQEGMVLPTSVQENIAYGRPDATPAAIRKAAELAGAAEFIDKLPQKYETQIQEGGTNLSGGQRQRLGIARALLTEAPIIVLDEPTSALDAQHEMLIIQTLRNLKRQRTVILVSHRLSTVADCDTIFVMEAGKIAESGTHDELVKQRGLYYRMAKHQMKLED